MAKVKMFGFLVLSMISFSTAAHLALSLMRMNTLTFNGRIVGGEPTTIEKVPHQVLVQVLGFGVCGGSIISENWIITAGHCASYTVKWLSVRAGTNQYIKGGTVHRVDKITVHEEFFTSESGIPTNDVALLKLRTPLKFDETKQPITLFEQDENVVEGSLATISGWGAVIEGGGIPDILQIVDLPIISKDRCNSIYGVFGGLPNGQICAAPLDGGKDSCQGDSGGPLTVNGRLAGIVSWGSGCARPGFPGVYTEVAVFRNWIDKNSGL